MSAAASAIVLLGELTLQGLKSYNQAKAAQAAATESDKAAIAELDRQIADEVATADADQRQLDADLGIASDDVKGLGNAGQL